MYEKLIGVYVLVFGGVEFVLVWVYEIGVNVFVFFIKN